MGEHKVCQPTQNRHSRGGGEREGLTENVFEEIMAENFPNRDRKQTSRCRKHKVTDSMNPRHIIIKMATVKERIQKTARKRESYTFLL